VIEPVRRYNDILNEPWLGYPEHTTRKVLDEVQESLIRTGSCAESATQVESSWLRPIRQVTLFIRPSCFVQTEANGPYCCLLAIEWR